MTSGTNATIGGNMTGAGNMTNESTSMMTNTLNSPLFLIRVIQVKILPRLFRKSTKR